MTNNVDHGGSKGWTIETLRVYFEAKISDADHRYQERFNAQQAALLDQKEAVASRFANVNELRGALSDATKTYMPRAEAEAKYASILAKLEDQDKQGLISHSAINVRLDALSRRMDLREGEMLGSKDTKGDSRAMWAIIISVAAAIAQAGFLTFHFSSSSTPAAPQVIVVPGPATPSEAKK